jgi:hypothetical protein
MGQWVEVVAAPTTFPNQQPRPGCIQFYDPTANIARIIHTLWRKARPVMTKAHIEQFHNDAWYLHLNIDEAKLKLEMKRFERPEPNIDDQSIVTPECLEFLERGLGLY